MERLEIGGFTSGAGWSAGEFQVRAHVGVRCTVQRVVN